MVQQLLNSTHLLLMVVDAMSGFVCAALPRGFEFSVEISSGETWFSSLMNKERELA